MGKLKQKTTKKQKSKKQQRKRKSKKQIRVNKINPSDNLRLSLKKKCHACYYNLPDQYSHMHCTNGCLN